MKDISFQELKKLTKQADLISLQCPKGADSGWQVELFVDSICHVVQFANLGWFEAPHTHTKFPLFETNAFKTMFLHELRTAKQERREPHVQVFPTIWDWDKYVCAKVPGDSKLTWVYTVMLGNIMALPIFGLVNAINLADDRTVYEKVMGWVKRKDKSIPDLWDVKESEVVIQYQFVMEESCLAGS